MSAKKLNLVIRQGETFQRVVRWEMLPLIYKPITGIARVAPVQITAVTHGCPDGWRATVKDAGGMDEINAKNWPPRSSDFHKVAVESGSVVNFNDVSAVNYDPYTAGGYLVYYTPVPLVGFTARMKIRDRVGGTELVTLASPTNIVIDTSLHTITVLISASASELFAWTRGVYDLELVSGTDVVTAILTGAVTVTKEVTTS